MLGYFILLILFLALLSLCFFFGIQEWLRPRSPLPIDVDYVREENYFGVSFRSKMLEWLSTARPLPAAVLSDAAVRTVLERGNGERILCLAGGLWGKSGERDELIYCEGNLSLPEKAVFHKEIYGRGNVESGACAQLQAVAADGQIILGRDNEVFRWVDARRKVLLRRGTVVHSRVSSIESIEMELGVSVQSLYAPLIVTAGYHPPTDFFAGRNKSTKLRPAVESLPGERGNSPRYLDGVPASRLGAGAWLVRGDLELRTGTCVNSNLIVQGSLRSGAHCSFSASVKAGSVELGPQNQVFGNVVSERGLEIGKSGRVGASVVAERDIILRADVRVGAVGRHAVVSAGRDVRMEANVAVYGKVAAGRAVVTV